MPSGIADTPAEEPAALPPLDLTRFGRPPHEGPDGKGKRLESCILYRRDPEWLCWEPAAVERYAVCPHGHMMLLPICLIHAKPKPTAAACGPCEVEGRWDSTLTICDENGQAPLL